MNKIPLPPNGISPFAPEADLWQALQLFNLYRAILSFSFWIITKFNIEDKIFPITELELYRITSLSYFMLSLFFLTIPFFVHRFYYFQINLCTIVDVSAIILLMHACGGMPSGIGLLLIVLIAAHSLLVSQRWALFSAAFATIFLFFEQLYDVLKYDLPLNFFTQIGLLGSVLFISAYIVSTLAVRIRQHEIFLIEQAHQINVIQKLNMQIVNAMLEGAIVFDGEKNIQYINHAACRLLNLNASQKIESTKNLPKHFQQAFDAWQKGKPFSTAEIRLNFQPITKDSSAGYIAFIYDTTQEIQRAQDLKLASLGHLTANIAHELRNPLGAISHASQLLEESSTLGPEEKEFSKIIREHCNRMNTIIQNVLSISSRKKSEPSKIKLLPWLKKWVKNFSSPDFPHPKFSFKYTGQHFTVQADPSQLAQVMINLCENGLRYSFRRTEIASLTFRLQSHIENSTVTLEIVDQGFGISKSVAKHIFEPFFTTEKSGSGLGLYLAKELCDMNNIRIDTLFESHSGAIFRLTFPSYHASSEGMHI